MPQVGRELGSVIAAQSAYDKTIVGGMIAKLWRVAVGIIQVVVGQVSSKLPHLTAGDPLDLINEHLALKVALKPK
jgi:hypothetical protein